MGRRVRLVIAALVVLVGAACKGPSDEQRLRGEGSTSERKEAVRRVVDRLEKLAARGAGGDEAEPALSALMYAAAQDPDPGIRAVAVTVEIPLPWFLPHLGTLLASPHSDTVGTAAHHISSLYPDDPRVLGYLPPLTRRCALDRSCNSAWSLTGCYEPVIALPALLPLMAPDADLSELFHHESRCFYLHLFAWFPALQRATLNHDPVTRRSALELMLMPPLCRIDLVLHHLESDGDGRVQQLRDQLPQRRKTCVEYYDAVGVEPLDGQFGPEEAP